MAELVLLQPAVGDMDAVRSAPHLPLGLLSAAARVARERDTVLIDQRLSEHWPAALAAAAGPDTICVAVTSMSGAQIASALRLTEEARRLTDAPILWGGIHATVMPDEVLADPRIDLVIRGEGELALAELVDALAAGRGPAGIAGVSYRDAGGRICHNPDRPPARLADLPEPAWALVDLEAYRPGFLQRRSLNVELSRGCTRRCAYCYNRAAGKSRFRALPARAAADRLLRLHEAHGIDAFYVVDDNQVLDRKRALSFAAHLVEAGRDIRWQSQGLDIRTALALTDDELDLLLRSGLNRVAVGADSGSPRVLEILRKDYTVDDVIAANRRLAQFPIVVYYSFLSGLPGEDEEDLAQSFDLMLQLTEENRMARTSPVYNYFPLPGTEIWAQLAAAGAAAPQSLAEWTEIDYARVNHEGLGPVHRQWLQRAYFPTLLLDRKFHEYRVPAPLRWAADLYRPVARWRVRHREFRWQLMAAASRWLGRRWTA